MQLINLYWEIGKSISEKQQEGWGKSVVENLSAELQKEFPGMGGFSECKDNQQRQFYILATRKFGWTKNVLIHQIGNQTYERYLLNQTNFEETLPNQRLSLYFPPLIPLHKPPLRVVLTNCE